MVLQIATESGLMKPVQRAWVYDGANWKVATCAWVSSNTNVMRKDVDCISSVSVTATALDHLNLKVVWSAPGATMVEVLVAGAVVFTSASPSSNYTIGGRIPGSLVITSIRATSSNNTVESAPITTTMPPIPPPGTLYARNITATSFGMEWSSVAGASQYRVYNTSNPAAYTTTSGTTMPFSGLTPGTNYSKNVKSVHSAGSVSAASANLTFRTQNAFTAGTYTFKATSGDTWEGTGQRWRGTSEGKQWHGDGGYFGAAGGPRYSFFFGYWSTLNSMSPASFFASQGAVPINLTKFEVYMYRVSSAHGVYGAQPCSWFLHQHGSKPTHPSTSTGRLDVGALALGQGAWFSLDLSWGIALMNGSHLGMVWGGREALPGGGGYMIAPTIPNNSDIASIRFTVG